MRKPDPAEGQSSGLSLGLKVLRLRVRMRPDAALEMQLARYRAMSREARAGIALRLHELACEMSRLGIRRQHPTASATEVERLLRERLELARDS